MSTDIVKYAFIAGEVSPTLYGRTDLTKYDLGVAEGHNFFVDYRGGLSSRPGFEWVDFVKNDTQPTRMFQFSFSPDLSNTYVLLFGHNYVRFVQDGAYVLSTPINITGITNNNPAVVTAPAHGLSNFSWVKIDNVVGLTSVNNRTWEVRNVTANTFELYRLPDLLSFSTTGQPAYVSGGVAAPVYEVATPYTGADLAGLNVFQYRDLLRITSRDFPIYNLVRNDHDDWQLVQEVISPTLATPDIVSGSGSAVGTSEVVFTVTQIDENGVESVNGNLYKLDTIINYTVEEGSVTIAWNPEPSARKYNVYRSIVAQMDIFSGSQLGFVGQTAGTNFTDANITPDFSRTPPIKYNPFAPGAIQRIVITAPGTGYADFTTGITITDPTGTGFEGHVVVNESGQIVNIIIKNPGVNYSAPTVGFTGAGTGATATATARALVGTFPALSCIFQQRQIYASSDEQPITIWGSQYKRFNNFDTSDLVLDNDSFEFDLDSQAIAPIRHILTTRGGLLAFTQENIWLLNGGAQGQALTPRNALADPQAYLGISTLPPIPIGSDVLFVEGKGYAVRLLTYNELSRVYSGEDRSILSNHLFGTGKEVISWTYQESPFKVVWAVRADGYLLAFTIVKSEEVYAWTPCSTKGKFLDVISVREGLTDRVYVTVKRLVNGRWNTYIERMSLRQFVNVEDAWCVDAGLSLPANQPNATISIAYNSGSDLWEAVSTTAYWTAPMVGRWLRAGQGIFKIKSILTSTRAELQMLERPTNFVPQTGDAYTFEMGPGQWSLDVGVTSLGGMWHLEGEQVSVLADGSVFPSITVLNGEITLPQPVTRAIVGLAYTCQAKTLPMIVPDAGIEAKRKRIVGIAVRLDKSRGLTYGRSLDSLHEMRERTTEAYGTPTRLLDGFRYQFISSNWDEEGQTYFQVTDPLPVTMLSLVSDIEVGDDSD